MIARAASLARVALGLVPAVLFVIAMGFVALVAVPPPDLVRVLAGLFGAP